MILETILKMDKTGTMSNEPEDKKNDDDAQALKSKR